MSEIKLKSEMFIGGEWKVELSEIKMVSIPDKRKYNSVGLCFKPDGDNYASFQFIEQHGGLIDYDDLSTLFEEIAKRWNAYEEKDNA